MANQLLVFGTFVVPSGQDGRVGERSRAVAVTEIACVSGSALGPL